MKTDFSEKGLGRFICTALTGEPCDLTQRSQACCSSRLRPMGCGWLCGSPYDYDREYCVDLVQLRAFMQATQPKVAEVLGGVGDSDALDSLIKALDEDEDSDVRVEAAWSLSWIGNSRAVDLLIKALEKLEWVGTTQPRLRIPAL